MSRMSSPDRKRIYPLVVQQQGGEYCVYCNKTKEDLLNQGLYTEFCIDVDDNSGNHSITNLRQMQLLCKSCNTKKNHPQNSEVFQRSSSAEIVLGTRYERDFRKWVIGLYMENENAGFTYEYVVNNGADYVGCSTETVKRYLKKMTCCNTGNYRWDYDRPGEPRLVLKSEMKF